MDDAQSALAAADTVGDRRLHSLHVAFLRPGNPRIPLRYDREAATARAKELRAQGLSLNKIGLCLRKERLTPMRGGI